MSPAPNIFCRNILLKGLESYRWVVNRNNDSTCIILLPDLCAIVDSFLSPLPPMGTANFCFHTASFLIKVPCRTVFSACIIVCCEPLQHCICIKWFYFPGSHLHLRLNVEDTVANPLHCCLLSGCTSQRLVVPLKVCPPPVSESPFRGLFKGESSSAWLGGFSCSGQNEGSQCLLSAGMSGAGGSEKHTWFPPSSPA